MQGLVKLFMNSLYGVELHEDSHELLKCKYEHWMEKEYDDVVLDSWKIPNGNFIVKFRKDDCQILKIM